MTPKAKRQLEYTVSTHEAEHLSSSVAVLRLCENMSDGAINVEQAVDALLREYGLDRDHAISPPR